MSKKVSKEAKKTDKPETGLAKPVKKDPVNAWKLSTAVLSVVLLFVLVGKVGCPAPTGQFLSESVAAEKTIDYINNNLVQEGSEATLVSVEEENQMYKIMTSYQGREIPIYMTKGGEYLFLSQPVNTSEVVEKEEAEEANDNTPTDTGVTKTDKPKVEMFIMSHCPYGTQIQKGIIPVAEALGDKIDFSVKFVYYAMHGETELNEQMLQHCIQEEQDEKYIDYISCFLKEGNTDECVTEAGTDETKLDSCIVRVDDEYKITEQFNDKSTWLNGRFPLFDIDKDLNEEYGVRGSPALVVNGKMVSSGRDPASLLEVICSGFSTVPEECSTELSSETPSPGFGFEGTGSDSGSCG